MTISKGTMKMLTVFLLLALVAFAGTAGAVEREGRSDPREALAGAGDPYPQRDSSESNVERPGRETESTGILGSFIPARDTLWGYLVTAALVTIAAVLWWVFFSVSLKGACWFSLVEASLLRCAVLAIFITALSLVCFGTAAYYHGSGANIWSPDLPGGLSLLATASIYLLTAIAFTKLILKCKWRSVITVWIMSTFVATAIVSCTCIGILAALPAEAATLPLP
jgi:hypothetical protein